MPSDNSRDRMAQLLAQLLSSSAETHERETARRQLGEELARQGQTLDDLYLHLQPDARNRRRRCPGAGGRN